MVSGRFTLPALNELAAPDHILFGSDFPFMPVADIQESTDDVFDFTGYTGEDVRAIASGNALQLLPRVAEQLNRR